MAPPGAVGSAGVTKGAMGGGVTMMSLGDRFMVELLPEKLGTCIGPC